MKTAITLCLLLLSSLPSRAEEVWVVGGLAGTRTGPCSGVRWQSETILHNRSNEDAFIRVLQVSNGGQVNTEAPPLTLPARRSLATRPGTANSNIWVTKLDVSSSVAVESRLEYVPSDLCAPQGHPPEVLPAGKIGLPVFRQLVAPGEEQAHYGTDLGRQRVRLNVAIYNVADVKALATITVHRPLCASNVQASKVVEIAADSIIQVPMGDLDPCLQSPSGWSSFVTVVVDQPSFSFVSTLNSGAEIGITAAVTVGK